MMPTLAKRTAEQLVIQAAELLAFARTASTLEVRRLLEVLAERYRELAARRAALACLADDDPARAALSRSIGLLARRILAEKSSQARPGPIKAPSPVSAPIPNA